LNTSNKKLNTFTLSGLIIGPILGSGIILLPPLLFNNIAQSSIFIWLGILILGFVFALIFGKLAVLYKGEGGVSLSTKEILGKKWQLLTSFYLIFAVFFGPVAVLLIAAQFLQVYFSTTNIAVIGFGIYIVTYLLLIRQINFIGKIMLFVTSITSVIFIVASMNILINVTTFEFIFPDLSYSKVGYSFLLVFWAIVGWEVIGNYSNDVKDKKTLSNSVIFSAIMVSIIYLLVASAIVFGDFTSIQKEDFKLVYLLEPIFKNYSNIILNTTAVVLCIGTLILFVGGVARLISSLNLTKYSSNKTISNIPIGALNILSFIYIIVLILVYNKILNISDLVTFADGFFIANAIIGLITAIKIFKNGFMRYSAIFLVIVFFAILLSTNIFILSSIVILFLFTYFGYNKNKI